MLMYFVVLLAGIASLALPVLGVMALVSFLRRGRELQGHGVSESLSATILDSLDQVHVRLDAVNDRLARLERSLEPGGLQALAKPEGDETDPVRAAGEGDDDAGAEWPAEAGPAGDRLKT
jgi:hypothetical protein